MFEASINRDLQKKKKFSPRRGRDKNKYDYGDVIDRRIGFERVTKLKRENQLIEEHKEKIKYLDSASHLRQGKEKQKIDEERAYSLSLECFGFERLKK